MQKKLQGSGDFDLRHELDTLVPVSVIRADPATQAQLPDLAAIARREIPGVNAEGKALEDVATPLSVIGKPPEAIFRAGSDRSGIDPTLPGAGGMD